MTCSPLHPSPPPASATPLWLTLSPRTPHPLRGCTVICHPPLLFTPSHMHSSTADPHAYFLWETCCLYAPLPLITIEHKKGLMGGTGHAALMHVCYTLFFFIPGKWQNTFLSAPFTAAYSLWQ